MRKLIVTVLMILLIAGPLDAQTQPQTLSLAQAVARVNSRGFEIRMARADAQIAAADRRSAQSLLRPQIGISANVLDANEPQLGMPIARQTYAAVSLTLPLFTPANGASVRAAREAALAADSGIASTTSDAVFATVGAYRRVQLADAVLAARRVAVSDQERHLHVTEQRVAVGKAARYLTLRERAALATATQAQEDASSERDQAANELEAYLDLPQQAIAVEALAPVSFTQSRDSLFMRALRARPSLIAAEQRVSAAQSGVVAARDQYLPTASLSAQSYNGSSSPQLGQRGGQVQLSASLPLIDGGSRSAATSRAKAQYDRVAASRDQIRAGVLRDVANTWREYEAATRNLATASATTADAQEQLRLAELRENAGKANSLEVQDALAIAAAARETTARSLARYDLAIAAILHATGDDSY